MTAYRLTPCVRLVTSLMLFLRQAQDRLLSLFSDFVLIPLYVPLKLYPRNLKPLLKLVSLVLYSSGFIASFTPMIPLTQERRQTHEFFCHLLTPGFFS
jgi:hypothetical protein